MEAAIQALSETPTGFLGVDATGAIDGDDEHEPALVTRLSEVAGAAAEAFAASTATPPVLRSPSALGMWEFGNAAAQCRAADAALTEALVAGLLASRRHGHRQHVSALMPAGACAAVAVRADRRLLAGNGGAHHRDPRGA